MALAVFLLLAVIYGFFSFVLYNDEKKHAAKLMLVFCLIFLIFGVLNG